MQLYRGKLTLLHLEQYVQATSCYHYLFSIPDFLSRFAKYLKSAMCIKFARCTVRFNTNNVSLNLVTQYRHIPSATIWVQHVQVSKYVLKNKQDHLYRTEKDIYAPKSYVFFIKVSKFLYFQILSPSLTIKIISFKTHAPCEHIRYVVS